MSNWTLTNALGYTLFKGIGLGFELGLRQNKQEALNNALMTDTNATFKTIANKITILLAIGNELCILKKQKNLKLDSLRFLKFISALFLMIMQYTHHIKNYYTGNAQHEYVLLRRMFSL